MGGLVARYAIGRLYRPNGELPRDPFNGASADSENSFGTIYNLEAMNFITVATPHLGSRGNRQVFFFPTVESFQRYFISTVTYKMRYSLKPYFPAPALPSSSIFVD